MNWKRSIGIIVAASTIHAYGESAHSLTVGEGFIDPLGFHDATPTFSWKLPAGVAKQTAYRLQVKDVWDSGWVESDQSVFVPYKGPALQSRQQLSWRVDVKDETGKASGWSKPAKFELGLLSTKEWIAQWIQPVIEPKPPLEFKLIQAIYRSQVNPDRSRDVTALVKKIKVKDDILTIHVRNHELGDDLAPGEAKELVLSYTVNGKKSQRVMNANNTVFLSLLNRDAEPVAYLRREFPISGSVEKARLYVTARGLYQVSLNGKPVGDDAFAPGWTSYDKRIQTRTYDVSALLEKGKNALGALLGTGWYAGRLCWEQRRGFYGSHPELLLQLEITYDDGTTQRIVSDKGWKSSLEGPIRSSSIYDGETYDASKELPGWDAAGFNDSAWEPVKANADLGTAALKPKSFAPVRVTQTLPTQSITEPEAGRYIFDLGQNMVGYAEISMPMEKGQTIKLRFAEMLNLDGTMYTDNYRGAESTDYYTAAKSGSVTWRPTFTFHGFRYVEVSGLPKGVKPQADWVNGLVLHSDLPVVGTFETSHEKLNQLQSNITWGQRGNFVDIPTDCPQRDERVGWTGDAQVFCSTSMFNLDAHAFWKSWLVSVREAQYKSGQIPSVVPNVFKGRGSPGWVDVATMLPWDAYVRTGDTELLSDNYEMMKKVVGYYRNKSQKNLIKEIGGYGDWLQPHAKDKLFGDTPIPLLGTAFYAKSTQILADSAVLLGKTDDAATYQAEADAVKKAFYTQYFDDRGTLQHAPETQTAYIIALHFDLVPQQLRPQLTENLLRLIREADGHLRTGFLGTPYIAQVLDESGHSDIACSLLFKETYPSWFYPINQGATTMWERWDSYTLKDGFHPDGMNSFNHYAYGAIGQWMYERITGIAPDPAMPGYKHFFVRPIFPPQLDHARATLETSYGTISSGWKRAGEKVTVDIAVPPNTAASIELPGWKNAKIVGTGNYTFEWETK